MKKMIKLKDESQTRIDLEKVIMYDDSVENEINMILDIPEDPELCLEYEKEKDRDKDIKSIDEYFGIGTDKSSLSF